ncbi:uncharacterized protein LOC134012721 [Osmerus eperlanus]|uniref:uncharacterized protein LOC134012721 n=1 Tax=Osmerus eperlanus TaxID=29151 RepID=UPI002E1275E2
MPTNLQGHVGCSSNTLLASWSSAPGALTYTSTLTSSDGLSTPCSSTDPSCSFPGLKCAQKYSLCVVASNSQCNSSTSASLDVTAAPCDPKNVTARLQCVSGAVSVSWVASAGAKAYTAVAQLNGSNVDSCTSTLTSCDLSQLRCGNKYTVIVLAGDGTCNSTTLASTTVQTAPCPPVIQNHTLDCSTNRASVFWALSKDVVGVLINATSASGHSASCQSNSTSCVLTNLLCGQNYTTQGFSLGSQCNSKPSDAFQIVTAPCIPANVKAQYTCGTSKAVLSWDETLGRDSFYALVTSGNHSESCRTAGTQCSITSLRCGQLYNATVYAISALCNSSQPGTTQIQTAPCAPQDVSVSLVCANNTAVVTWLTSPGAVRYDVLAVGRDGDSKTCATNGTSCTLSGLPCDKTYNVTVTPFSPACEGFQSTAFNFTTGPCPRPAVQVSLTCTGNVGSVSWASGSAGELYVATATGSQGHAYNCSTNGTGCSFGGLNCGETYTVSVVTVKLGCRSEPSAPVSLTAAICPPTNLAGVTACSTNNLNITWAPSPASSAVTYFLYSQKQGGVNATYTMAGTSKLISGLQCGEHFTFRVSAQDSKCTSGLSPAIEIDTAPCAPTNLTAQSKCGTTKTALAWNPSDGAVAYVATVTGPNGRLASCVSNNASCSVALDCGLTYSAAVAASTTTCNSTVAPSIQFDSAQCLPSDVAAQLPSCTANTFSLQWKASPGNPSSYTGLAIGSDGSRSTCNTSLTACTIQNLSCGTTYSLAVTTSSSSASCGKINDTDYKVQSAPCKPTSPAVNLECSSNAAQVTWQNTGPDQLNVVSAVDRLGRSKTCNSTGSNCTFTQLGCGEQYTLSVVGQSQNCTSAPSTTLNLLTAPCVPTQVEANVDCENGITMVTWDQARGALRYTVLAEANGGGHNDTCENTDTICIFSSLRCGQVYTITVLAYHDSCGSLASQPITASTGPCPHSGFQASLDCSTNTAVLSWTPGQGIVSYNATAEDFNVPHLRTCATNGSSCNISGLQCGENYRMSVRGEGLKCLSPSLEWLNINTAPCPPTQLKVLSSCDSNTISVSWVASKGSLSYMAVAECTQGQKRTCNTTSATCNITGLVCGQEYKVYVVGLDDGCAGAKSNIYVLHTAPCVPANVQSQMDCRAAVLNVTWQQSGQTQLFHTSVQSSAGTRSSCARAALGCVVPDVQCGLNYTVVVLASYESCNSSQSALQQVRAAPCPPDAVKVVVNCSTSVAAVTWNNSVAGVLYTATAVCSGGRLFTCSAPQTGCNLSNLTCGMEYNVTVTPSRGGCVGADSPVQRIRAAPCIPRLTEVDVDCLSDSAWVIWERAAGAELYVAVATDRTGTTYTCNTTDSSCAVPELPCGQNFTFTVAAADQQCSSAPSNAVVSETAPCPPQDVEADMSCENGSVAISWAASTGAVAYTATLERTDGQTTCCSARGTQCDITGLPCGKMYVLIVTAEGRTCNSSESIGNIVRTAPCTPQKLEGSVTCRDNVGSMNWTSSRGGQLYTVTAVGTDGHVDKCSSFENTCDLTGLRCGQHYTAAVVANDSTCNSPPSNKVDLRTVPCTPDTVSATVSCQDNSLKVSWSTSRGADSYTASVEDGNGSGTTCQAMSAGFCNISGLSCGQLYHASVVASDGYCSSPVTEPVVAPSVPCQPTQIRAEMDCESRVGMLTWSMSAGAVSYRATAIPQLGQSVTCDTNNTHCYLDDLACGEEYSVSVEARGENCSSVGHMTGTLITEPCIPLYPTTTYSLNIAQVSWDRSKGSTSYRAEAVTDQGVTSSCQTSDTYCALHDIECGKVYNVSITASNEICQGVVTSDSVSLTTEPCPPKNIQARVHCGTDMGTVSWEESEGAVGYVAKMEGRRGDSLSCSTTGTFCNVTGLHCGSTYLVTVFALGEILNSSASATILLTSAPCVPASVQAHVNCANDSAAVTWAFSDGADSYTLMGTTGDGFQAYCATTENHCNLTGLACGQSYNLSLTSINQNCQVESPTGVSFSTRPCAPLSVGVEFLCGNNTATLSWKKTEGVQLYRASATPSLGGPVRYCNSTGSSCTFPGLDCGETYRFTVTAYNSLCQSESSNSVEVKTAPCQPSQLVVEGSCSNETVSLSWAGARGASVYVLTAAGDLGYFTALQTNDTALDLVLPCGQTYSFTVTAEDERCGSPASSTARFKTAPCIPYGVTTYIQCEAGLGAVSWGTSDGAEYYTAIAVGTDSLPLMCTTNSTNSTTCTWDNLLCGDLYVVHVIANDHLCSSSPSNSTSIHTAPCVPQNLTSSINCATKVTTLQWLPGHGADLYVATAEAASGTQVAQSTNDTRVAFSELTCGQSYSLSVQAVDSVCRSVFSLPAHQDTEPCPPTSVSSVMDCQTNIAVVSWGASPMADYYTATLKRSDGQTDTCMSSSLECGTSQMTCGQNYTVTVTASRQLCQSNPSPENTLHSVPCVPTNVVAVINCSDNTARVSWNASKGALFYVATAENAQGGLSTCESAELGCTLTNLTCGALYTVSVVARDSSCGSLPSQSAEVQTVPCTPQIQDVVLDCFLDSAQVVWSHTVGSLAYTVTATGGADESSCRTNNTNCELLDLTCGQVFTVSMVASDGQCDSFRSSSREMTSVPCPPEQVVISLDCSANSALVAWKPSQGAESYRVQAIGVQEHETGCETTQNSCLVPDLLCGFTYNISVVALNGECNVSESNMTQLQSVPCVPNHVEATTNCASNVVSVSWEPSNGATLYTAVASGSGGNKLSCDTIDTVCIFANQQCSGSYNITVSASDHACASANSTATHVNTVPCKPQNVTAKMECTNNTGLVSWERGVGMSSYQVSAIGPDGHQVHCASNATSCRLPSMHCGQLYNVTVAAQDGTCNSSSTFLTLQSVPCKPTSVKAALLCKPNAVAVTWERASGAAWYQAVGVTADGGTQATCNNSLTFCDLTDLPCGQTYNVTVFAKDEACSSVPSSRASSRTAPCPPQNVTADVRCSQHSVIVSWAPDPDADYFDAVAQASNGVILSCNTTGTSCTILNLLEGHDYNVSVASIRGDCKGKCSLPIRVSTAPLPPTGLEGSLDCVTNSAWMTWQPSSGAQTYTVLAVGSDQQNLSCTTSTLTCNIPNLACGTNYTFSVIASNAFCNSTPSNIVHFQTGPCALTHITIHTQCNSSTILVGWEATENTPLYLVTAEGQDRSLISCNSTSSSCLLASVLCGMQYTIIVSASSDKCSSLRSPPQKVVTEPCTPKNVSIVPTCQDNSVTVSWPLSVVATSYLLTVTGRDGDLRTCNTSVNNCSLGELHCGQPYSFSVTASTVNCTSQPSTAVTYRTVPCSPTGLRVESQCKTNSAVLSWNATEGAEQYYVRATCGAGSVLYCNSNTTSCTIGGLWCGAVYNYSVQASDRACNGSLSKPLPAGAVPCPPATVTNKVKFIGQNFVARVSWSAVVCPNVTYLVEVTGRIQDDPQALLTVSSYWTEIQYFEIPLPCSTSFSLTVRSRNLAGESKPSTAVVGITGPCPPPDVEFRGDNQTSILSWGASVLAVKYTVYVTAPIRTQVCVTPELSCNLTNVSPNVVEVTASNAAGESVPSTVTALNRSRRDLRESELFAEIHQSEELSVPEVKVTTVTGVSLYVEWGPVRGATHYTLVVKEDIPTRPHREVMVVYSEFSIVNDLKPSTIYCILLSAKNARTQSSYSTPLCVTTGVPL